MATKKVTGGTLANNRGKELESRVWPDGLVIQCKWQASSGSVEEKYPFEVLNIQKDEYPTIIVLDGGGYSKGSEN